MSQTRKKRSFGRKIFALLIISIVVICLFYLKDGVISYIAENDQPVTTKTQNNSEQSYVVKSQGDIGKGNLILVNGKAAYQFPQKSICANVSLKKNGSYKVSDSDTLLDGTVISHFNTMMHDFEMAESIDNIAIVSGYRTIAEQKRILDKKSKAMGKTEALKWAARPGYSEHHTGLAMDIGILKDSGHHQSYTGTGKYSWINENCGNYGFIHRYSGNKEDITGVANEPWHYRYVGRPHANIVASKGFCFEEYIDYLKNYSSDSPLPYTDSDGTSYEIYYVKKAMGKTKIPVPKTSHFSISGNNVDGFIVTVEK